MQEFIFGPLTTQQARVQRLQADGRGIKHAFNLDPLAPGPGDSPLATVIVGLDELLKEVTVRLLEPEQLDLPMRPVATQWDLLNWSYTQTWQVELPPRPAGTVVRYTIEAQPENGDEPIPADGGQMFSYLVGNPRPPAWAAAAIIYQILPDRFHPGHGRSWLRPDRLDGIYGGTLLGILDQLDYIADLGFNCIWLNPFFPDEKTHHGYHATDYFAINPRLGDEVVLRRLVDKAHSRGIRLLLDFVANHWGSGHPTFQAAQSDRSSRYYDWYRWKHWPDQYETFFQVGELPQVNLDHPPARRHMLDAALYWLTEFDFDGFRLDYSLGPSLDFWTDFGATVRAAKADAWMFGEAVDTPATQLAYWGRLHGSLDFFLLEGLRQTFAFGTMGLVAFDAFLANHEAFFPKDFSRPSFLDNHDMNRFLWLVHGDRRKLKVAALCQFTLGGPPIVYYGTEAGLSQERDVIWPNGRHIMAEARQPMLWGDHQDIELRDYYRRLVHFRRRHPALWRGARQTVHLDQAAGTYAYQRFGEQETVTVALNLSEELRSLTAGGHTFSLPPCSGDVAVMAEQRQTTGLG